MNERLQCATSCRLRGSASRSLRLAAQSATSSTRRGPRCLSFASLWLPFALCWLIGCEQQIDGSAGEGESTEPTTEIAANREAAQRLKAVQAELSQLRACSPGCLATLEDLADRWPRDPTLLETRRHALTLLQDWQALIDLETSLPPKLRRADHEQRLANLYFTAGRFADAAPILSELVDAAPQNADLRRQYTVVLFRMGEHQLALAQIEQLEELETELSPRHQAELDGLRGLAALYSGDRGAARRFLEAAHEIKPDSLSTLGGLIRLETAAGRAEQAARYAQRAQRIRQQTTENTRHALLQSTKSRLASDACMAREWDLCEERVNQLLAEAKAEEKPRIYQYLAQVMQTAGRTERAAQAAVLGQQATAALANPAPPR